LLAHNALQQKQARCKKHLKNPKQTKNNKLNAAQQICCGRRAGAGLPAQRWQPSARRPCELTMRLLRPIGARLRAGEGCAARLLNQKRKSAIARNDRALLISENEGDAARRQRE
jgi:hypothetical protein